ncbi:MAG: hypothetical protein ACREX4_16420, partial [Gammaproteobacteria bacterium]
MRSKVCCGHRPYRCPPSDRDEDGVPMERLEAEVNACGGTPTKQASALLPGVHHRLFVPSHRRVRCTP